MIFIRLFKESLSQTDIFSKIATRTEFI